MKAWLGHSPHLICGLPHMPLAHSFAQAGA